MGRNLQHLLKGIERRRREKKGKEKVTNQNFIKIQIKIYFIFHILFSCSFIFNFFFEFFNPVNKLTVGIIKLLKLLILR